MSIINYKHFFDIGIDYDTYIKDFEIELNNPTKIEYQQYYPLNWQRQTRIFNHVLILPELADAINQLKNKANWLLISENWCGDASQIVPVIGKIALQFPEKISLKIIYRDQHTELIDAHLTGKSRSIPKLIQLNNSFDITGTWGPRPANAQKLVLELKSNPQTSENYQELLHKWYATDKQVSIQEELILLLKKHSEINQKSAF